MRPSATSWFALLVLLSLVGLLSFPTGIMSGTEPVKKEGPERLAITDIRVSDVLDSSVTIAWRTNLPADSQVVWRRGTTEERATPNLPEPTLEHAAVAAGLRAGTRYDFYVISQTPDGRIASEQGPGFKTEGLSPFDNLCDHPIARRMRQLPTMGTGIAWADFDNDGGLDVFVGCERMFGAMLFRRKAHAFVDATNLEATKFGGSARSAAWADFDADGDLDLLVCRRSGIQLFANQGPPEWKFLDVSTLLPAQKFYDVEGAGWIDYNNDGAPDIVATNGKYGVVLFENQFRKSKNFSDAGKAAGLGEGGVGAGFGDYITIGDYDRDGRTDFLYNLYTGMLFQNTGGAFVRQPQQKCGITYFCSSTRKLGTAFSDYDNDGDIDIFVPQRGPSKLFQNQGNGAFKDVIAQAGEIVKNQSASVAAWGDIDNDGDLDLYLGNEGEPNRLFLNMGNGTFADRTDVYGVAAGEGRARGMCFVDYDDDGDLDLYVHNYTAPDYFFDNGLIGESNHNYLKVKFPPKPCPIGALVSLYAKGGEKPIAVREISGGEGWGSQSPPEAHFGVKPGDYRVRVVFTSGAKKEAAVTTTPTGKNVVVIK